MQQFAYTTGKNATDSALIIDAMDLLYTGNLDGFCLVSSDSDFTKLASRLRESGKTVYGFGEPKTPEVAGGGVRQVRLPRRAAPRREVRAAQRGDRPSLTRPARRTTAELRSDAKLVRLLREGIDASSDDEGWAHLGGVGHVRRQAGLGLRPPQLGLRQARRPRHGDRAVRRRAGLRAGRPVREKPKGQPAAAAVPAVGPAAARGRPPRSRRRRLLPPPPDPARRPVERRRSRTARRHPAATETSSAAAPRLGEHQREDEGDHHRDHDLRRHRDPVGAEQQGRQQGRGQRQSQHRDAHRADAHGDRRAPGSSPAGGTPRRPSRRRRTSPGRPGRRGRRSTTARRRASCRRPAAPGRRASSRRRPPPGRAGRPGPRTAPR